MNISTRPMVIAVDPAARAIVDRVRGAFIDGQHRGGNGDTALAIFNPATGQPITDIPECSVQDVELAVASAHAAFVDGRWRGLRPADRERILFHFAETLARHTEEVAQIESWNQGKSINVTRAVDVGGSVEFMRYFAGLATKITGMTMDVSIPVPAGTRYTAYTRREPVGVVGAIAPWNFPLMIGIWKVLPALAAGCCVVLKPSEVTPLSSFRLAELAIEAGVPPGVFNVVHGRGQPTGEALVVNPLVAKVSFTGSTAAGKHIGKLAIGRMARLSLELGGKNPAVVLRDADLAKTVPGLIGGALFNSGQVCAAISRIYVERPIYRELADQLARAIGEMTFGSGLDPAAQITPLVSAAHWQRVRGHLAAAESTGLEMLRGGTPPQSGYFVSPTLLLGAQPGSEVQRTEIFGPVISLAPVDSADEAVHLANDTEYGLSASLWTENLTKAMDIIPRLNAGTIWVNAHIPLDPSMPFGGFKASGIGRDFGPHSLDAFTEVKSVCIAH